MAAVRAPRRRCPSGRRLGRARPRPALAGAADGPAGRPLLGDREPDAGASPVVSAEPRFKIRLRREPENLPRAAPRVTHDAGQSLTISPSPGTCDPKASTSSSSRPASVRAGPLADVARLPDLAEPVAAGQLGARRQVGRVRDREHGRAGFAAGHAGAPQRMPLHNLGGSATSRMTSAAFSPAPRRPSASAHCFRPAHISLTADDVRIVLIAVHEPHLATGYLRDERSGMQQPPASAGRAGAGPEGRSADHR